MPSQADTDCQVAVIGGGPAGLAAGLTLSRSMVRNFIIDAEEPARNGASPFVASLPGFDRKKPEDVRAGIRQNIETYPYAQFKAAKVAAIQEIGTGFELTLSDGSAITANVVLLASGMVDVFPKLENMHSFWGRSIINCPFCHGIEWQDARWGIFADRPEVLAAAEIYRNWSDDLVYFIGPDAGLDDGRQRDLLHLGIQVVPDLPKRVDGSEGALSHAILPDGRKIDLDCLLVYPRQVLPDLVAGLAIAVASDGCVQVDDGYRTSNSRIYAAGDLIYQGHQNTPTALHMGNMAAASIVMDLCFKA